MGDRRVINICFHGIGVPGRDLEPGEDRYWVTKDQYLETLDEIATWPRVQISFDDGNASDAEIGLGGLVGRGMTATFFALAGRIGSAGSLDADQLRDLRVSGMAIGTHGMDHRPWRGMDPTTRHRELVVARQQLADIVGAPIEQAALPLGRYDRAVLDHLRGLGYSRVHSSDRRPARQGAWLQPRFSVRCDDTIESLRSTVLARPNIVVRLRAGAVGVAKRLR
jgi:peptidoglycan/xylan/chitin deacetylase (PgdA/CDA1 family)